MIDNYMGAQTGRFKNRIEAGQKLAAALKKYRGQPAVVYALPRGGVVVGAQIAQALKIPLDLIIARKIGHPYQPEYAIAAVTESGSLSAKKEEVEAVDKEWFKQAVDKEKAEAGRRRRTYLKDRQPISAAGKIAILVDDGIATGLTMQAAIHELKKQKPLKLVIAAPMALGSSAQAIGPLADDFIALSRPFGGFSIGGNYDEFPQVEDEEVISWLGEANK